MGILALEKGLIDQDGLNEVLSALTDDGGPSLVDLLRSKSGLKPDQIDGLRKEAIRRIRARGGDVPDAPSAKPAAPSGEAPPAPKGIPEAPSDALPSEVQRATRDVNNVMGRFVRVQDLGRGNNSAVFKA